MSWDLKRTFYPLILPISPILFATPQPPTPIPSPNTPFPLNHLNNNCFVDGWTWHICGSGTGDRETWDWRTRQERTFWVYVSFMHGMRQVLADRAGRTGQAGEDREEGEEGRQAWLSRLPVSLTGIGLVVASCLLLCLDNRRHSVLISILLLPF